MAAVSLDDSFLERKKDQEMKKQEAHQGARKAAAVAEDSFMLEQSMEESQIGEG